eukprot:TRINITY_DN10452_c0_g1_i8.p2 TRINITY_DN10452_c0_g1~~TRINITY_DN10452_c0_g1_i8.p2  ORF type:complete len:129 (-),score=27.24 TRINITY_DN10452_c0_g1_i8:70-456(-)
MVETEVLKEDIDTSAPLKTDGMPSAEKRKVLLGTIIGGAMFLGILIALIVLVSGSEAIPRPKPVPPAPPIIIPNPFVIRAYNEPNPKTCLLYTSDAADDTPCVDLGGRRIIKKKKKYDRSRKTETNHI